MFMKKIKIFKINTLSMEEKEIDNSLEAFQSEVEGYIEIINLGKNCILVCNDEGKIKPSNVASVMLLKNGKFLDFIVGNCFICNVTKYGNFKSLTEAQIQNLKDNNLLRLYRGLEVGE